MAEKLRLYWLHALTSLHVGAGQGVGFIDLPIIREKVTGWPLVPGSAVKGVRRDHAVDSSAECRLINSAFGRSDEEGQKDNSGSLVFTDARLACLPVRSLLGTFAWITSPLALRRLWRDLDAADLTGDLPAHCTINDERIHVCQKTTSALQSSDDKVYLEDLNFTAQPCPTAQAWGEKISSWIFPGDTNWQRLFIQRFAILSDNHFDFLCETATEINTRIRIDQDRKTVAGGALWYEEALPAESILAGLIWCDRIFPKGAATQEELLQTFCTEELALQIGGKATIGKGRVRCLFTHGG